MKSMKLFVCAAALIGCLASCSDDDDDMDQRLNNEAEAWKGVCLFAAQDSTNKLREVVCHIERSLTFYGNKQCVLKTIKYHATGTDTEIRHLSYKLKELNERKYLVTDDEHWYENVDDGMWADTRTDQVFTAYTSGNEPCKAATKAAD